MAELLDTSILHTDRTKARMFDAVAGSSEVSIVAQDCDGTITFWNRRAQEMFGYASDEAVGERLVDHLPEADRARELAMAEAIQRGDTIPAIEITRQRLDGTNIDVSLVVSAVRDEAGKVTGMVRMSRDVTQNNRYTRELANTERRLRTILEATTVPLGLNDSAGNITYLNSAFTLTFGYTREDIPNLEVWWSKAYPDPVYRQKVASDWAQRMNESVQTRQPFCPVEVVIRCKNGTDRTVIAGASEIGNALADTHLVSLFDITELVQARLAIARSERFANLVLSSVGDGLCQIDAHGFVTYINAAGATLLGYDPSEVIGKQAHALFHHSHADGSPYPLEECPVHVSLAQRTTRTHATDVFWRKDGSSLRVSLVSAPVATADENFGAVVTFRDISEEVRMRMTLEENEVMIRKAQEIAGFGSYATDLTTGKWKSSPVLDWIFGIDDSFPHDIAHWNELLAPEFRQPAMDHYLEVAAGKCDFRMDYQIIRPRDGVRRWIAANGELEFDANGNPIRLIGTIQDIHERKLIEAELQKSHNLLAQISQWIPGAVYQLRNATDGTFTAPFATQGMRQMVFVDPTVLQQDATVVFEMVHPDDRPGFEGSIREAGELLQDWVREFRVQSPQGQIFWRSAHARPERQPNGDTIWYGYIFDVTDRMLAQQKLRQLNDTLEQRVAQRTQELAMALDQAELAKKSRGEFLAKMSHEIRTPLNAIQGLTYLTLKMDAPQEVRTQLTKIRDSGKHLLSIVNDILDFSKIDAGKLILEIDDFDLSSALHQVVDLTRVRAQEKNLDLTLAH